MKAIGERIRLLLENQDRSLVERMTRCIARVRRKDKEIL